MDLERVIRSSRSAQDPFKTCNLNSRYREWISRYESQEPFEIHSGSTPTHARTYTFWSTIIQDGEISSFTLTQTRFDKYVQEKLTLAGDRKAADIIRKTMTNQFEAELKDIAASGASFADRLGGNATGEEDEDAPEKSLCMEMQAFRKCLMEVPVPIEAVQDDAFEGVPGDDDSEFVAKLHKQVVASRKNQIVFLPGNVMHPDFWKKGGAATAMFQKSKFSSASGEAGKEHALMILNAEVFPFKELFQSATAHKDVVSADSVLKSAAKWVMSTQGGNVICLLADGRSRKVRRAFEDIVEECQVDEQKHLDACIIYGAPPQNDIRFPTRRTFGGLRNLEKLLGSLPLAKVRMTCNERNHFSACGEKTTYASSYTSVPFRSFKRLPRLSIKDKESIVGMGLPTYPESIVAATGAKGHPLFWNEVKDVDVYVALFKDLNVKFVFDVASGSGAAAMAAGICGASYEGFAMNANHVNWLNRIIAKAMFAIIADSTDEESKQLRTDLASYFGPAIDEARELLASGGDSDSEINDNDNDGHCDDE